MAADRWGNKPREQKQITPEQFEAAWQGEVVKLLRGEPMRAPDGHIFVRCGRKLGAALFCLARLGHSSECAPVFANICDAPLPNKKRCVLTAGHRGTCLPHFPRANK